MRIAFFTNQIEFSPERYEAAGLGGSECALINILNAWPSNQDELLVYNGTKQNPPWRTVHQFYSEVRTFDVDVLVLVRDIRPLAFPYIDAEHIVLWSQDDDNEKSLHSLSKNAYYTERIDHILSVSEYAKERIRTLLPNPIIVVRNGYRKELIERNLHREPIAVYSSTPFRGLSTLKDLWPLILEKCRVHGVDPTLYVFGDMTLYNQSNQEYKSLYDELRRMEKVEVFGNIPQVELYKHLNKSKVMLYPNCHIETSCMAVLEALACGNYVVTSNLGALPEQVNSDNGICIDAPVDSDEYRTEFLNNAVYYLLPLILFQLLRL